MAQIINTREEWADLLTLVPVSASEKARLRVCMAEPTRHYHDSRHIALLWARHKRFGQGHVATSEPWHQRMACAIAYHDIVYEVGRTDNEMRSVSIWEESGAAIDDAGKAWVSRTIAATSDHLAAKQAEGESDDSWAACSFMLDLDLTPIGEGRAILDANTRDLRREFAHLSDQEWEKRRIAFLKGLLAAPMLYRTPVIAQELAARARANLEREIAGR